jgi:hypothetical protein
VTGGDSLGNDGWRSELAQFIEVLRERADDLAYGYAMRGWEVFGALALDDFSYDWPVRQNARPRGTWGAHVAFEDLFAPDAFGVQLLGAGYAGRLPHLTGTPWSIEAVGELGALVAHHDPEAWFSAPFVRLMDRKPPELRDVPEVLAEARDLMAPILHAPGALVELGFDTMTADE